MSVIGLVIHFIAVGPHRYSFSPPCERSSIIKEIIPKTHQSQNAPRNNKDLSIQHRWGIASLRTDILIIEASSSILGKGTGMAKIDTDAMAQKTLDTVTALSKLPVVRVDRGEFLRKQFKDSEYLDRILEDGPQSVYTPESLRNKAGKVIAASTTSTSLTSFAAGLPGNPVAMVAVGGADVVQYFGFALNMAQKLAYLFGDDDLFSGDMDQLSEQTQNRIIAYLAAMVGVSGASTLILNVSAKAGGVIGKRVAAKALTKTVWYPIMKKTMASIGVKITKQTVGKVVTKAVPVLGGVVSGGITYVTFRPMGKWFADMLVRRAKGDLDDDGLELNPEFLEELKRMQDGDGTAAIRYRDHL